MCALAQDELDCTMCDVGGGYRVESSSSRSAHGFALTAGMLNWTDAVPQLFLIEIMLPDLEMHIAAGHLTLTT
jgi:hypothetical protein